METEILQQLNRIENKLDCLLRPNQVPSSYAIMHIEEEQEATSREDYVFQAEHLENIHFGPYGYHFECSARERQAALERVIRQGGEVEDVLNHLYALWTVWKDREYEGIIQEDICWVEEKYL